MYKAELGHQLDLETIRKAYTLKREDIKIWEITRYEERMQIREKFC